MAGISDRAYSVTCGRLATALGVSLASARRRVEIRASQAGIRDGAGKLALAEELLAEAQDRSGDLQSRLTEQLGTVGRDDRFMVED
jgi:hypothetical protein